MTRIVTAVALALALAGCVSQNLTPITPTPAQVAAEAQAITTSGLSPSDYLNVATELATNQCASYFDALAQQNDKLRFAGQSTNILGGAAAAIMGSFAAPGSSIALAGISAAALNSGISDYAQMSAAGLYPDETGTLVQAAQTAYLQAAPQPTTPFEAAILAQRYAQLCSYAGIHSLARQAVATARPVASGGTAPATGRMSPGRMVPPTITVVR